MKEGQNNFYRAERTAKHLNCCYKGTMESFTKSEAFYESEALIKSGSITTEFRVDFAVCDFTLISHAVNG